MSEEKQGPCKYKATTRYSYGYGNTVEEAILVCFREGCYDDRKYVRVFERKDREDGGYGYFESGEVDKASVSTAFKIARKAFRNPS